MGIRQRTGLAGRWLLLVAGVWAASVRVTAQSLDDPPVHVTIPPVPVAAEKPRPGATGDSATPPAVPLGTATNVLTATPIGLPQLAAPAAAVPQPAATCEPATPCPPARPEPEFPAMRMYWNNGLFARSEDKSIVFHTGGTMQYDFGWFTFQPQIFAQPGGVKNVAQDGSTPRRIRVRADGTLWEDFDFFSEIEFVNGFSPPGNAPSDSNVSLIPSVTEVWLQVKNIPYLGNLRAGNMKEPLGLEHLNSDRYLEFMERSFVQDLSYVSGFNNGFSPGFMLFRTHLDQRVYTAIGMFENINDPFAFATGDGEYAVTGRVAALPIWDEDEKRYWHVGGAMSHRDTVSDGFQSRIRGQIRSVPGPFLPVYADTGLLTAYDNDVYSLETLFASGRFTFMSEYMANVTRGTVVNNAPGRTLLFQGWYAQALFFLTDDHRPYNRNSFTTNRVTPKHNFSWSKRTWGAWEAGVRYSTIDLNDGPVIGGKLDDVVIGLTWFLNPLFRVYFNYEYLYRHDVSNPATAGIQHAFGTRLALDF
jgi:phosphate-selective porin OprO and OprP